jgi:hypothetical protein
MAIRGVSLSEREEYILADDPGNPEHPDHKKAVKEGRTPEEPTIFYICNLTAAQKIEIGDIASSAQMRDATITIANKPVERSYRTVQYGLKGWKNMLDHSGKPVSFEETTINSNGSFVAVASDGSLRHLSNSILHELARKIMEKNGMMNELEKKFAAPLQQFGEHPSETGDAESVVPLSSESEDASGQQNSGSGQ